jgi:hypothetical protein
MIMFAGVRTCQRPAVNASFRTFDDTFLPREMPSWDATHTGTLSARECGSRGQGTFVECTDQP